MFACDLFTCTYVFQFDEEFLSRQEAQAQLVKCEEKIAELQAELQAFRSQVQYVTFINTRFNYSTMPLNLAYNFL